MKRKLLTIISLLTIMLSYIPILVAHAEQPMSDVSLYSCDSWSDPSLNTGLSVGQNKELIDKDVPLCIKIKNEYTGYKTKMFLLNGDTKLDLNYVVYGGPDDIIGNDYAKDSNGINQPRYLGFAESGDTFPNIDFPPDVLGNENVGTRKWYTDQPWTHKEAIDNSHKPYLNTRQNDYPDFVLEDYLKGIVDKYTNTNPGNFANLGPDWTTKLYGAAVWSQMPREGIPGLVTMWSKGLTKDWYDSFIVNPPNGPVPTMDMALNPQYAELVTIDDETFIKLEIFSNYKQNIANVPIYYRWSPDSEGSGAWDRKTLSCTVPSIMGTDDGQKYGKRYYDPSEYVRKLGVKGHYVMTSILAPLVDVPEIPLDQTGPVEQVDMGKCIPVTDYSDVVMFTSGKSTPVNTASDVMEDMSNSMTDVKSPLEDLSATAGGIDAIAQAAMDKAAAQYAKSMNWTTYKAQLIWFIANVNPNRNVPDDEIWYGNNRVVFPTAVISGSPEDNSSGGGKLIKTPPLSFKGITAFEGTAYWTDVNNPALDKYVLKCSPAWGINYSGTLVEHTLKGLTPNTTYNCNLEAFDNTGASGGIEKGSFTTKSVAGPVGNSFWDDRGLIRQINSVKQSMNSIPTGALDFSDYSADEVKGAANQYSPYFGEKIGAYADPSTKSKTYSWSFNYTHDVWDSCKSTVKDPITGKVSCVGGFVSVTDSATDNCQVTYAAIGPKNWSNITTNPTGMTLRLTNDWNDDAPSLKVVGATAKQCIGGDGRDPSPNKFTYYVPTIYQSSAEVMTLDTGFDSTTNEIMSDYQDLNAYIEANVYTLGADGRTLTGQLSKTPISFSMKWSIYTALGAGQ